MDAPDRAERTIRFGCGAAFGLVAALLLLAPLARLDWPPWPWGAVIAAAVALACGWAARRYGDDFWYGVARRLWWR